MLFLVVTTWIFHLSPLNCRHVTLLPKAWCMIIKFWWSWSWWSMKDKHTCIDMTWGAYLLLWVCCVQTWVSWVVRMEVRPVVTDRQGTYGGYGSRNGGRHKETNRHHIQYLTVAATIVNWSKEEQKREYMVQNILLKPTLCPREYIFIQLICNSKYILKKKQCCLDNINKMRYFLLTLWGNVFAKL